MPRIPKQSKKLDKETKKVIEYGKKIKDLTEHAGWDEVRNLFIRKAAEMLNMANVNVLNPQATQQGILYEIAGRQLASARLLEILNEIQGTADQFDANASLTEEIKNSSYIIRNDIKSDMY